MVSQVYYINSDQFPAIANDYNRVKSRADKNSKPSKDLTIFTCALETIPTFRRTASLEDKIDNGDYLPAAGALGLTLVNIKEDMRDVESAAKQIYSKVNPNYHYDPLYNRHDLQHEFSFTKGLIGEKYMYKKIAEGNKIAQNVHKLDKTIDKTTFGNWLKEVFNIETTEAKTVKGIKNAEGKCARAYGFKSSIWGGETTARAMKRTTLAGVLFAAVLELPKIFKETSKGDNILKNGENGAKQIVKSTVNVASTTAGIAYGGAIGAKYAGATGSLIGMGIGAILGSKVSNKLQDSIN